MKKNILVFPCGSEIGLEINNSVKYSTHFHLIGGSSVDDHGLYVYDDYIGDLPFITNKELINKLKEIITERNIDAIYPTMDMAITVLKGYEDELKCKVISSPYQTSEICLSKAKTYERLKDVVQIQKIYKLEDIKDQDLPIFVKPEVGYSGQGTYKVNSLKELETNTNEKPVLYLEYLPGEEYTVDCFTNRKGELLYFAARERKRIKSGISVNTVFASNQEEFRSLVETINNTISFRGAWFAQFKRNKNGQLCLMEIATRLGGSSALSRAKGVNLALLTLFDAFDYDVNVLLNHYEVEMDRALSSKFNINIKFNTVYVDYDDCLVLDKRNVNTELLQFIFQCRNRGIVVILLTKHEGDLEKELDYYRIKQIFDKVIHIQQKDNKYKYINNESAIFIDDSYAEREEAARMVGVPVFSPEMVSMLI